MQLIRLSRRVVQTRAFKIVAIVCALVCIASGAILIHYYHRYSRMIDTRLNGHVFENTAKIFDGSGELLTSLSGEQRAKRRLVEFKDIPKDLIDAVTAGEDQRFFVHHGVDLKRIVGAFLWDVRENGSLQGASTITQQLARSFFLTHEPTLRRKLSEAFIAILLEHRLTKSQIFTMYANEVYLGERGLYSMHGFGEAAWSLFGKDLHSLTLAEAATIAGIIPAPNTFSPSRHPERAFARRNLILTAMRQAGSINEQEYRMAREAELHVNRSNEENVAPYFVDFVRDELLKDYSEDEVMYEGYRVRTTLDPKLQRAAWDAVAEGLASVEKELAGRNKRTTAAAGDEMSPRPQAALIALEPRTGEIKAMVGGADYRASQFNRVTQAFRQPGSAFKPFVYAAALETAYNGAPALRSVSQSGAEDGADVPSITDRIITPLTRIFDAPRVFSFAGEEYRPDNFEGGYGGLVTVRIALQKSLNSAAVQVAERIGYGRIAAFAHRMGLNRGIKGYPSVALGAFEVTPLELAGAYTAFANQGKHVEPHGILRVETAGGADVTRMRLRAASVVRPEIAYLITYLMEGVINRGTGAGVRARGFRLPAAGKTGTTRDGWFVGYTKNLLVVTWVGFDDNRDLGIEGSHSALPIWTDFMLKAYALYPPKERMDFTLPSGIEFVDIDAESMLRATPDCPDTFKEAFISGTAPVEYCPIHTPRFAEFEGPLDPGGPVLKTGVPSNALPDTIRAKPEDDR